MQRLCAAQQLLYKVRHRDAHKGDRPRKGSDTGGQQTGKQHQHRREESDVHANTAGVLLAHLVGRHGFGEQKGCRQYRQRYQCRRLHIGPCHAGKAALRPVVQVDDVGVLCKGHHDVGDSGTDVADHHTADDQNAHALHPPGHRQHKGHGRHGTRKGSRDHGGRAGQHPAVQKHHHGQGHRQLCAAGNAHDKGPGNGVCKKGLQKVSRCTEGCPQQRRHDRAGQAQLQDDVPRKRIAALAQQRRQHRTRCKGYAAPEQVQRKKHSHGCRKGNIGGCKASGTGHRLSFL